jgi:lauroyl/myristoyl acyltransferase
MTPEQLKSTSPNPATTASNPSRPPVYSWHQRLIFIIGFFVAFQIGRFLIFLAKRQSWEKSHRIALWISRRVESLTRKTRWKNYGLFFGGKKSPAELAALDEAHTLYLARMRADVAAAFGRSREELLATTDVAGLENLRAVLEKKCGTLLVSGHMATWWLVPSILSCQGFRVTAIFTPVKSKAVEKKLRELADRFGVRIAFVGRDAMNAVRYAALNNEIIYLTFDVTVRPKHLVAHPFAAARLTLDAGPALTVARQSMPTLQVECQHLDETLRKISIHAATEMELNPRSYSPQALCDLWARRLEAEVLERPEQWWAWGYVDLLPPVENPLQSK